MNTRTTTIVVIIVILAGVAFYYFTNTQTVSDATQQATSTATTTVPDGASGKMAADASLPRDPKMSGTWQSTDDSKFTRTFSADGTVSDAYEGDASADETGTWTVVDPTKEVLPFPVNDPMSVIVRLDFQQTGLLFFSVNTLTDTDLSMIYLDRGNTLSFKKVQ